MKAVIPLMVVLAVLALSLIGGAVPGAPRWLLGVFFPYAAILLFIFGFVYRVWNWAKSPVPYRITTTCGQAKSLPWIKSSSLESPHNTLGVIGRMALEVLFFRSLFRNTQAELQGGKLSLGATQWLWLGGLAFHWSFLVIILRHTRFFTEPVPAFVGLLQGLDGLFRIGMPVVYITTAAIILALTYLLLRRFFDPRVKYISLPSDYLPLYLILGIALTGALMRHFIRVDVVAVKELAMGLATFRPVVPEGTSPLFFAHITFVSALLAYFPLSKLMHMGGIFLSPTRNMANDNRMRRHVNPWNYPVKVHTYAEWQEEYKDKILIAGLELDETAGHDAVPEKPGLVKPEMAV